MTQKEKEKEAKDTKKETKNSKDSKKSVSEEVATEQQIQSFDEFLTLKDMGITIKQGEFVCIIGDVASGKSSLLNAIIGELVYASPSFK